MAAKIFLSAARSGAEVVASGITGAVRNGASRSSGKNQIFLRAAVEVLVAGRAERGETLPPRGG